MEDKTRVDDRGSNGAIAMIGSPDLLCLCWGELAQMGAIDLGTGAI